MRKKSSSSAFGLVVMVAIIAAVPACLYGWINNIIILWGSSFDPLTGPVILRVVGIFLAPLGVVMGYL